MTEYVFKLPDLGEGTVEAEIVVWVVRPGDDVREGDHIADVMTDKANVEVSAPVSGVVLRTTGEPGDMVAVGAELAAFDTADSRTAKVDTALKAKDQPPAQAAAAVAAPAGTGNAPPAPQAPAQAVRAEADAGAVKPRGKVITSPAIRRQAQERGVDLQAVVGSGPRGRIVQRDLDQYLQGAAPGETMPAAAARTPPPDAADADAGAVRETKIIGVRRAIARQLQKSTAEIPHFAYVEEVDVTELESLRSHLNANHADAARLTLLPFICLGLRRALATMPRCNAIFDAQGGILKEFSEVHLGVAAQTPDGLKVPVVRHLGRHNLWSLSAEISRLSEGARANTLAPREMSGSTITVSSLGRLGGIVSTPIINHPEVAIIGVNKAVKRPVVIDGQIVIRLMMNLSSSFDHRFVDGHDAALLIQQLKDLLEHPATIFLAADDLR